MKKNWLEWLVLAVSTLLVLATASFLIFEALRERNPIPIVEIDLGRPIPQGAGFLLPVTATNRGDETAERLLVEVTMKGPDGKESQSQVEIEFVPRGSRREGWVRFEGEPVGAAFQARILGFEKP